MDKKSFCITFLLPNITALQGLNYAVIEEIYYVIKEIVFTNLIKCPSIYPTANKLQRVAPFFSDRIEVQSAQS
jgi:hypothetical protein